MNRQPEIGDERNELDTQHEYASQATLYATDTSQPTSCVRFELVAGPQAGASEIIDLDVARTLGSGFDNDIMLLDQQIDDVALVFESDVRGAVMISIRSGTLMQDDQLLEGAGPHRHVDGSSYRIGASCFAMTVMMPACDSEVTAGSTVWRANELANDRKQSDTAYSSIQTNDNASIVPDKSVPFGERSPTENVTDAITQNTWLPRILFGIASLLCVAIGVSYALHSVAAPALIEPEIVDDKTVVESQTDRLAVQLRKAGFDMLTLNNDDANARLRVGGYVQSRQQLNALEQLLRGKQPRIDINVHVQNNVVDGVRNVYRTNGIKASVEPIGPGEVRVVTAESEAPDSSFMKTAAMEDVAGLASMETHNEPPPEQQTEAKDLPPPQRIENVDEVGKQVVSIVKGDPSYVVTRDDSRYFVGSLLPTGHTIEAIDDQGVMLKLHGQKTSLEF